MRPVGGRGTPPGPAAAGRAGRLAGLAAAAWFAAAGAAGADEARTWFTRGAEALRTRRYEDAAAAYAKAEALAATPGGRANAANGIGLALFKSRRYADAIPALARAVELDPGHAAAWNTLGNVYLREYETGVSGTAALDSAIAALTRAVALNPAAHPDDLRQAQEDLATEQAWAAAAAKRAGQPPRSPAPTGTFTAYKAAGEAAEQDADFDLAAANYARAESLAATPRSKSAAANFLGLLALRLHRPAEALGHLRRSTGLDPTNKLAWNNLGVAALGAYDAGAGGKDLVEEAVAAFGKVRDLDPQYKPENLPWATAILTDLGGPASATVTGESGVSATAVADSATVLGGAAVPPAKP